eukprot:14489473-Ditylum_brightwellii.AAC.1
MEAWSTPDIVMTDNGEYLAQAIKESKAIAVSDGSYKAGRAIATCTFESEQPFHHCVTASATSPGDATIQDTYRADWALYHCYGDFKTM